MKGKIKYISIAVVLLCIIITFGYRYKEINKGVPKSYQKDAYKVNEVVDLDELEFKINSYNIVKGDEESENTEIIVNVELKNNGCNNIDVKGLLINSKLSDGFQYIDSANISEQVYQQLQSLGKGETLTFSMEYSSPPELMDFDNGLEFYVYNELYKNQIAEKYKDGKFYAKYVELK